MQFKSTAINGVIHIIPDPEHEDFRGTYIETYHEEEFRKAGIDVKFVVDDHSRSRRNVLRGMHGDSRTWKLISCLHGAFFFAVSDVREESPTKGKWQTWTLSDRNHHMVLVPPGCANGHLALDDNIIFHYKQSEYYGGEGSQFSYRFDDPRLGGIVWPISNPILSPRDTNAKGK
jgi:dTDP-4-dehydrorhamnose 3,5-epimerase